MCIRRVNEIAPRSPAPTTLTVLSLALPLRVYFRLARGLVACILP